MTILDSSFNTTFFVFLIINNPLNCTFVVIILKNEINSTVCILLLMFAMQQFICIFGIHILAVSLNSILYRPVEKMDFSIHDRKIKNKIEQNLKFTIIFVHFIQRKSMEPAIDHLDFSLNQN